MKYKLFLILIIGFGARDLIAQELVKPKLDQQLDINIPIFVNGQIDSISQMEITAVDIYSVKFETPNNYPSGTLYVLTHKFVKDLRPAFHAKLALWAYDPTKIFIVDEKPLVDKRLLLTLPEEAIEGFCIVKIVDKETIEIFLKPGYILYLK